MRKLILSVTLILLTMLDSSAQKKVVNEAYQPKEMLEYRVHYGFVDAGVAKLEVAPELKDFNGRQCLHVIGTGRSTGAFDWFFSVRDRYESYIDTESLLPWMFIRKVDEGGYTIDQKVRFNHANKTATSEKKTISTRGHVQDLLSAFYYARTLDFNNAQPGDTFHIDTYLDDEIFPLVIKYTGKETIKCKAGKFRCIVFHPMLLEGRVFKEQEGMTIWVSDDKNRIPIRAQADILIGSIKMDLKNFSGVASPLALVK